MKVKEFKPSKKTQQIAAIRCAAAQGNTYVAMRLLVERTCASYKDCMKAYNEGVEIYKHNKKAQEHG